MRCDANRPGTRAADLFLRASWRSRATRRARPMAYPLLARRPAHRSEPPRAGEITIRVEAVPDSMATIWDADVPIWALATLATYDQQLCA